MIIEYVDGKQEAYDDDSLRAMSMESVLIELKDGLLLVPFGNVRKVILPKKHRSMAKIDDITSFN